jgi:hypothetical protein
MENAITHALSSPNPSPCERRGQRRCWKGINVRQAHSRTALATLCVIGLCALSAIYATPASAQSGLQLIFNDKSQLCLEGASGRVAQLEECTAANNTLFQDVEVGSGQYTVENAYNQCLEVPVSEPSDGAEPIVGTCDTSDFLYWTFTPDGSTGYCWWDLWGEKFVLGTKGGETAVGTDAVIWKQIGGHTDQLWSCP